MARTGKQIQGDIYRMLIDSSLSSVISGKVYRKGYRPRDSRLEDIDVMFTAGLSNQIETGVVTINIYVPDTDLYGDGVLVEDGERTEQLEIAAQQWVDSLTAGKSNYKFKLQGTITTEEAADIHQHFVVIMLMYEYYGGE